MTKKSTPTRARKTTSSNCTHTLSNMGGFSGFCGVSIDQFPQVGGPVSFWAASPALPGYKLRRITEWMAEHLADEFSLPRLAGMAGLSEFHFNRLFKRATELRRPAIRSSFESRLRSVCCAKQARASSLLRTRSGTRIRATSPRPFGKRRDSRLAITDATADRGFFSLVYDSYVGAGFPEPCRNPQGYKRILKGVII